MQQDDKNWWLVTSIRDFFGEMFGPDFLPTWRYTLGILAVIAVVAFVAWLVAMLRRGNRPKDNQIHE